MQLLHWYKKIFSKQSVVPDFGLVLDHYPCEARTAKKNRRSSYAKPRELWVTVTCDKNYCPVLQAKWAFL
uniref:Uncharacterized protein n=1 Tax=Anguilla anguilla TaxID=7936 RepID=A0A0E9SJ93_ANGAN